MNSIIGSVIGCIFIIMVAYFIYKVCTKGCGGASEKEPKKELATHAFDDDLLNAVTNDNIEEVKRILNDLNQDSKVVDETGYSMLMLAIIKNNCQIARLLIEKNQYCMDQQEKEYGRNALMYAIMHTNDFELMKTLLFKFNDVQQDKEGNTALHYAITYEKEQFARYMISNNYFCCWRNNAGLTPFFMGIRVFGADFTRFFNNNYEICFDIKTLKFENALHYAFYSSTLSLDLIMAIVENGNVPEKLCYEKDYNGYGNTPLHLAALQDDSQTLMALVTFCHVKNIDVMNNLEYTPLFLATKNNKLENVIYLVEKCHADPDKKCGKEKTPREVAKGVCKAFFDSLKSKSNDE